MCLIANIVLNFSLLSFAGVACQGQVDVVFLVDGSDSVISEDFATVKQWVLHVVDAFEPSEQLVEELGVYVVQYSDVAVIEINALIANSSDEIKDHVSVIYIMCSIVTSY